METKFQTSFIPKKSLTQTDSASAVEHQSTSILLLIGIFIFIISVLAAGGAYGWQVYLQSQQVQYDSTLKSLKQNFNTDLIVNLKQTATKIDMASKLLDSHVALSQAFAAISAITASDVRFTSLDLQSPIDKTKPITINLSGYARSYESLAFQSDQLGHLEELGVRNIIVNPVISNPAQNSNSTVSFGLSANLVPESMLYKNSFTKQ